MRESRRMQASHLIIIIQLERVGAPASLGALAPRYALSLFVFGANSPAIQFRGWRPGQR